MRSRWLCRLGFHFDLEEYVCIGPPRYTCQRCGRVDWGI